MTTIPNKIQLVKAPSLNFIPSKSNFFGDDFRSSGYTPDNSFESVDFRNATNVHNPYIKTEYIEVVTSVTSNFTINLFSINFNEFTDPVFANPQVRYSSVRVYMIGVWQTASWFKSFGVIDIMVTETSNQDYNFTSTIIAHDVIYDTTKSNNFPLVPGIVNTTSTTNTVQLKWTGSFPFSVTNQSVKTTALIKYNL